MNVEERSGGPQFPSGRVQNTLEGLAQGGKRITFEHAAARGSNLSTYYFLQESTFFVTAYTEEKKKIKLRQASPFGAIDATAFLRNKASEAKT